MTLAATAREMIAAWSNRSFLFLTLSGLATAMATGLGASMNIYFNTFYWEFTSAQISALVAGVFVSAFVALFATAPLSRRFGKRGMGMTLIVLSVSIGIAPILLRMAGLMPANHSPALFPIIFVQSIVSIALGIGASTLLSAMIADVVEDGELKTGRRSEGLFFSASSLVAKAVSGVGIFAASMILALIRFPAGATPGHVPAETLRDLALVYAPILLVLYGLGLWLLTGYRITRASHAATLDLLAAQAARVARAAE
jgi:Na+/melibiose symporter-like transporter